MVEVPSFPRFGWDVLVIDTPKGKDPILGFDFLNNYSSYIDWRKDLISFNPDFMDSSYSLIPFSNEFSTSTPSAALVGDSRTPSSLTFFHIPFINSLQSSLSSVYEVCKEMKDVGEDNYISSFHLFHGNVDLPPSSYHDSL
ncbi:hypothetical protein O181_025136 [Austropuccinia psidii MF-1]|uniref:Uncharacterized protein n=1 Tax=Austropuccinia psidii MF-1 TaxID=1389203 RepID=A0A9Q3CMU1_9BASI|nr:hypothetical protein [Austropuccinia psidii MF-1]